MYVVLLLFLFLVDAGERAQITVVRTIVSFYILVPFKFIELRTRPISRVVHRQVKLKFRQTQVVG